MGTTKKALKKTLRQQLSLARTSLSAKDRDSANALINSHAQNLVRGKAIAAYAPLESEPGGKNFLETLRSSAREVWIPVCLKDNQLAWGKYDGPQTLKRGTFGILEPTGTCYNGRVLDHLELVLTPALAVDLRGFRLGKGAGYYDRALATMDATTAVCLFDQEILTEVPIEPHDLGVDLAITPAGIRYF